MDTRKSLLEQAKQIKGPNRFVWGEEHFELTKAWLNGEIGLMQIARVIAPDKKPNQTRASNMIMYCLRAMKKEGLIKIVEKK